MTTPNDTDAPIAGGGLPPRWWRVGGTVREDVRTAVAIHERFARETAAALSRVTRSEVEVAVSASEWMSFGEYLGCVPDPAVLAQVELPGSPAGMLVGLDTGTGLRVIDRLLGGSGAPAPPRGPTELELDLITDVLGTTVGAVGEVFGPTLTSPPQLSRVSTQPQLLRMVALTEPALVLTYRVSLALTPPAEGLLSLCYPAGAMGVLLGEVGRPADAPTAPPVVPGDPALRELVSDVEMDLVARLQPSSVAAEDLRRLRVGDVLILDHRRDHTIDLSIGDAVVLDGALGRHGRTIAVQVLQWRVSPPNAVIKEFSP